MTGGSVDVRHHVDELVTARPAAEATHRAFASWRAEHHPAASDLLDALAAQAADDVDALDALLLVVSRHGIARPAIRRLLIDPDDIDDAEQSTLAVVALRVDRFDGRSKFTTWLHTVATNEARQLIRSRVRRPGEPVADIEPAPFLARLSTLVADQDLVRRALSELPEEFRRAVELREFEHLDHDEIAARLGVPVGTVKSRLHRGRALLVRSIT